MDKETILVVDDEKEIRDLIEIYLKNEGYNTLKASDGFEALSLLKAREVQLIILDVMMPNMDGIRACMKIREERNTPIIMLSAKSEDMDKIMGLTTGADDYITKPFNPLELIARVKSQLRRYIKLNNNSVAFGRAVLELDDLVINTETHEISIDGRAVKLTPREFDILELLARNAGKVFSIENIYQSVWKESFIQSDNTVMVHIRKIREKIEKDPRNPRYIKTVWGVGYKVEK